MKMYGRSRLERKIKGFEGLKDMKGRKIIDLKNYKGNWEDENIKV